MLEQTMGQAIGVGAAPTVDDLLVMRARRGDAAAFTNIASLTTSTAWSTIGNWRMTWPRRAS
jgi:hypothetical protein